jgi:hypothetical protein
MYCELKTVGSGYPSDACVRSPLGRLKVVKYMSNKTCYMYRISIGATGGLIVNEKRARYSPRYSEQRCFRARPAPAVPVSRASAYRKDVSTTVSELQLVQNGSRTTNVRKVRNRGPAPPGARPSAGGGR